MATELSNVALQTVAPQANVLFTDTPVRDCRGQIVHREGSGIVTLRGAPNCARYKVSFGANVAIPTGGTVGPISLAITIDGEPLGSATMIVTPAVVDAFFNIFGAVFINVPCSCCVTVSVRNLTATAVDVTNANLIVERVA